MVMFTLEQITKAQMGEHIYSFTLVTSALDGAGGRHAPAALPPGTHFMKIQLEKTCMARSE